MASTDREGDPVEEGLRLADVVRDGDTDGLGVPVPALRLREPLGVQLVDCVSVRYRLRLGVPVAEQELDREGLRLPVWVQDKDRGVLAVPVADWLPDPDLVPEVLAEALGPEALGLTDWLGLCERVAERVGLWLPDLLQVPLGLRVGPVADWEGERLRDAEVLPLVESEGVGVTEADQLPLPDWEDVPWLLLRVAVGV